MVIDIINRVEKFNKSKKHRYLFIASSNNAFNNDITISQLKETKFYYYLYIVLNNSETLDSFLSGMENNYDTLLADTESKKLKLSVYDYIRKKSLTEDVIGFQPSSFAVEASRSFFTELLSQNSKIKNVFIKGVGKIGYRIIFLLNDLGLNVYLDTSERKHKIIEEALKEFGYNLPYLFKFDSNQKIKFDIIVGCSSGQVIIDKELTNSITDKSIVVDIGIGSVSTDLHKHVSAIYRISPKESLENLLNNIFKNKKENKSVDIRIQKSGYSIIKSGILGKQGELIFEKLSPIEGFIGVANGKGGLLSFDKSQKIYNQFLKNE